LAPVVVDVVSGVDVVDTAGWVLEVVEVPAEDDVVLVPGRVIVVDDGSGGRSVVAGGRVVEVVVSRASVVATREGRSVT
jgi:hypothetical protein